MADRSSRYGSQVTGQANAYLKAFAIFLDEIKIYCTDKSFLFILNIGLEANIHQPRRLVYIKIKHHSQHHYYTTG